jgi:hypothetical protein
MSEPKTQGHTFTTSIEIPVAKKARVDEPTAIKTFWNVDHIEQTICASDPVDDEENAIEADYREGIRDVQHLMAEPKIAFDFAYLSILRWDRVSNGYEEPDKHHNKCRDYMHSLRLILAGELMNKLRVAISPDYQAMLRAQLSRICEDWEELYNDPNPSKPESASEASESEAKESGASGDESEVD